MVVRAGSISLLPLKSPIPITDTSSGTERQRAISRHLHQNLLRYLAEKILLPHPLSFGGGLPLYGWHDMRVFIMDKVLSFDFCSATAKICLIEEAGPIPMPFVTIEAALSY